METPEQQRITRYALQPPGYILRLPKNLTVGDTADSLDRQSGVCRQLHRLVDRWEKRLGRRPDGTRRALTDRELGELLRRWSAKLAQS